MLGNTTWTYHNAVSVHVTNPPSALVSDNVSEGANVAFFPDSSTAAEGIYQDVNANFTTGVGYALTAALTRVPGVSYGM